MRQKCDQADTQKVQDNIRLLSGILKMSDNKISQLMGHNRPSLIQDLRLGKRVASVQESLRLEIVTEVTDFISLLLARKYDPNLALDFFALFPVTVKGQVPNELLDDCSPSFKADLLVSAQWFAGDVRQGRFQGRTKPVAKRSAYAEVYRRCNEAIEILDRYFPNRQEIADFIGQDSQRIDWITWKRGGTIAAFEAYRLDQAATISRELEGIFGRQYVREIMLGKSRVFKFPGPKPIAQIIATQAEGDAPQRQTSRKIDNDISWLKNFNRALVVSYN